MKRRVPFVLTCLVLFGVASGQDAKLLEVQNIVQATKGANGAWEPAARDLSLAIGDRVRTRQRSRATLRLTDLYTMRLEQFTTVEIASSLFEEGKPRLDVGAGAAFIFSREKSGEIDIKTPAANGAMRGTQVFVQVAADGSSRFQVLEGQVKLVNLQGKLLLGPGEAGEAAPGRTPKRTVVIEATNLLQWALYYPAVLDPDELGLKGEGKSVAAYREGDLLEALERHSGGAQGTSGKLYRAAVLLAVGRMDEAAGNLKGVPANDPGRRSIERMIDAVKFREREPWADESLNTAGEAIAESYYRQSRSDLKGAREAARIATERATQNGYAWTRLAELEFSFGRTKPARDALAKGLEFTPRNARAHALQGFILAADVVRAGGAARRLARQWLARPWSDEDQARRFGGRSCRPPDGRDGGAHDVGLPQLSRQGAQHGGQAGGSPQGSRSGEAARPERPDTVALLRAGASAAERIGL